MSKTKALIGFSVLLLAASLAAWVYQLQNGLIVTNMRNPFSWGLYIASFAYFVGIAAGGLIISSSIYILGVTELKPFTRIASLTAFASILAAGFIILPDLGRVDRIYNLLLHPNFRSPLVWDVIVVSAYTCVTFLSVYFQLLPDWKRDNNGFLNGWTKRYSQEEIENLSSRWAKRISLIGLPFAILIHTVTALIFATQASRSWWHTAVLPPDFIAVATACGTALVLVISMLLAGKERFAEFAKPFGIMALIIAGSLSVHFFFMYIDFLLRWWWAAPAELEPLLLTLGKYGWSHTIEVVLPLLTMICFFTAKGRSSFTAVLSGCLALMAAVFVHRFLLMPGAFNVFPLSISLPGVSPASWHYPMAISEFTESAAVFASHWNYSPTAIEYIVGLLPLGLGLLVISAAIHMYNFLPVQRSSGGRLSNSRLHCSGREYSG